MKCKKLSNLTTILFSTFFLSCQSTPVQINRVQYTPRIVNTLMNIYDGRVRELPVCLLGKVNKNTYVVDDIKIPEILTADETSTSFNPKDCQDNKKYLGIMHNHSDYCYPSMIDLNRFISDKKAKIESIVCGVVYPDSVNIMTVIKNDK